MARSGDGDLPSAGRTEYQQRAAVIEPVLRSGKSLFRDRVI